MSFVPALTSLQPLQPLQGQAQAQGASQTQGTLAFAAESAAADGRALFELAAPPEAGLWDEMRDAAGLPREAWRRFAALLPPAGDSLVQDLNRRAIQVERQIRLDGITHNVFNDQGVASRPWSLELLPLLIEPGDWARIEAGAVQRAQLLETVLADTYGPQRLLAEGLLPPALVLRHPGYLRPLRFVTPPGNQRLHIVAFDLSRGPDGRWWVVAQRTQVPSGLGYVLHNRIVVSRQFPDAFRDLRVQHIASSYRRTLDTLESMARDVAGGATPRVVLLTPGPYSETYFEHAYLARYLGLPLVEGGDLTVRDDRLFLKTVEGLEPVHGLLRRLDDEFCDPLELRPDSALGIPGLLQAVRAGRVVMANALGSGFLESPAVQGFLPGICRRLLGEELLLPPLPSWWCGEKAAWRNVRQQLADKVVRSTFPHGGRTSRVRDPKDANIDADPDAWTVQSRMRFSRAPLWSEGRAQLRPAMVRVYAIADGNGRWHVLPGGMTRVAASADNSLSMQRGGSSLDTWVLTDGPVDSFSMLPKPLSVDDIVARRRPVSSRTAENLFWLGRYTERTEQLVRLARATLVLIGADNDAPAEVLAAMSALAVNSNLVPWGAPTLDRAPQRFEQVLLATLCDSQGGMAANLKSVERSAQSLRERLSSEQWGLVRAMGETYAEAVQAAPGEAPGAVPGLSQMLPALDRLALQLAAVTGAQTDRMTRDHGWRLLAVGRLVERLIGVAAQFGAFIDAKALASPAGIDLLLELFDSAITFRARYQRHEGLLALTDLLVLDDSNPRAFAGVMRRLRTELGKLPGSAESLKVFLDRLPADGAGLTLEALRGASDEGIAAALAALALRLSEAGKGLADDIGHRYFAHTQGGEELQRV